MKKIYLLFVLTLTMYDQSLEEEIRLHSLSEPEIALEASKLDGWYFQYIDKSYRNNKEFVLEVLKDNGRLLQYVSKHLRADKEVVMTAVKSDKYSVEYADKSLQKDRDILLANLSSKDFILNYQSDTIKDDEEVVLKAIKSKLDNFLSVSERLRNDKNFLSKVLDIDLELIKQFDAKFYDDKELMLQAIKKDGSLLFYASQRLRSDQELIAISVKNNKEALQYVYPKSKGIDLLEDKAYIERKFKKDVWKYYKAEDAIEALYGKKIPIEKQKDNRNFLRYQVNHGGHSQIRKLWVDEKAKSLAIFQDVKGERSLISYFKIHDSEKNHYFLDIKVNEKRDTKLTFVTEYKNGKINAKEYKIVGVYFCREGDERLDFYDLLEKVRENFVSHYETLSDIKIKIDKSRYSKKKIKIDIDIRHNMRGYNEAKKLNKKVDFLTHVIVKHKEKTLLESYLSEYVSQNPRISFYFNSARKGDNLEFQFTDIYGNEANKTVPIEFRR